MTTLGVLYNFTPTTSLTIGHMFDNVKHATARDVTDLPGRAQGMRDPRYGGNKDVPRTPWYN